ncbi:MAG: hypothetical protein ACTSV6_04925, partial [Candidatus Heimdallarchaeota archaeon]
MPYRFARHLASSVLTREQIIFPTSLIIAERFFSFSRLEYSSVFIGYPSAAISITKYRGNRCKNRSLHR